MTKGQCGSLRLHCEGLSPSTPCRSPGAQWVRKNITPTTAHIHNDSLTAGRLAEECLWEAQGENLNGAELNEAAGGNLLTFMVSALNRAAEQKIDEEGE
jgi:hypothetical protein